MTHQKKINAAIWAGSIMLVLFLISAVAGYEYGWTDYIATTIIAFAGTVVFAGIIYGLERNEKQRINHEARLDKAAETEQAKTDSAMMEGNPTAARLISGSFTASGDGMGYYEVGPLKIPSAHAEIGPDGEVTYNSDLPEWSTGPPEYDYDYIPEGATVHRDPDGRVLCIEPPEDYVPSDQEMERANVVFEINQAVAHLRGLRARLIAEGNKDA